MPAWPYDALLEIITAGTTTVKKTWGDGIMSAIQSVNVGTRNLFGSVYSRTPGVTTRPGSGAAQPFVYLPDAPADRVLIDQWVNGAGIIFRRYQTTTGIDETLNALWTGGGTALWTQDTIGVSICRRMTFDGSTAHIRTLSQTSLHAPWTDGTWATVYANDELGNVTVGAHFICGSGTPTIAADAAGTGTGSATLVGNDLGGRIEVVAGAGAPAHGKIAGITFAKVFSSAPKDVLIVPANRAAWNLGPDAQGVSLNITASGFDLNNANTSALASTITYDWTYVVIG